MENNPTNGATMSRPASPSTALSIVQRGTAAMAAGMITNMHDLQTFADAALHSGLFKDIKSMAQAIVKAQAGRELGIPPMRAMQEMYVIEGKIAMSATLMAGIIKRSGIYTYKIDEHSEQACQITFFERNDEGKWIPCGPPSRFTIDHAKAAGVGGRPIWGKYPRNMLFARAMSNGARWYCAELFTGAVYVPEELGASVTEDNELIVDESAIPRTTTPPPQPAEGTIKQEVLASVEPQPPQVQTAPRKQQRTDWQRKAAMVIYPKVASEVQKNIKELAQDDTVDNEEFSQYLLHVASIHSIQLPENPDAEANDVQTIKDAKVVAGSEKSHEVKEDKGDA